MLWAGAPILTTAMAVVSSRWRGSSPSALSRHIIEAAVSLRRMVSDSGPFIFSFSPAGEEDGFLESPSAYFQRNTERHLRSISDSVSRPDFTASSMAAIPVRMDVGSTSMSAPASNAPTQLSPPPGGMAPFMASPSVKTSPSNPSSLRSVPSVIVCDMDDAVPLLSSAGTLRCPTITPPRPAAT